jgi:hypothetical protein
VAINDDQSMAHCSSATPIVHEYSLSLDDQRTQNTKPFYSAPLLSLIVYSIFEGEDENKDSTFFSSHAYTLTLMNPLLLRRMNPTLYKDQMSR